MFITVKKKKNCERKKNGRKKKEAWKDGWWMERIKQGWKKIGRRKERSRIWMNEDINKTVRNKEVCKETVNFLEDGKWARKKKEIQYGNKIGRRESGKMEQR